MSNITRRDLMAGAAGLAAAGALGLGRAAAQSAPTYTPEAGASLRMLRWVPFVPGEGDAWKTNTAAFTEATGVEVRIDEESWEDVRPKAAVAANVGSGPDMVMSWFDDPFQYPDKLIEVTELAEAVGAANGGWYDGPKGYAVRDGKFIAMPLCAIGNAICYRQSHLEAAGFTEFPKDSAGFLELCKALKANNTPAGFPHGKAVGDGNNYAHWLLWSNGGKMINEDGTVGIDSAEARAAIEYAKELYATFIPGTESWLDINNNRAFLAGQVSLTANGVSLYYAATKDPALAEIAADIRTTNLPIGPVGSSVELHQTTSISIFNHTQVPAGGAGLPGVHVRHRADERLDRRRQCLLLRGGQGLRRQPGLDLEPDPRALFARLGDAQAERLCRPARLCLGGGHGRLRAGRHVRRGGHRPGLDRRRHRECGEAHRALLLVNPRAGGDPAGAAPGRRDSMASTSTRPSLFARITESRNGLGLLFMLPAAVFLLCFLTYPLGLGVWLGFTDTRIGREGVFIGLENYAWLAKDRVFWLSVFNTLFYTTVASVLKFGLGLWLAVLLNQNLRFKTFFRAVILLPYVVPTVLSALAFWWIFDSQFSILSWVLMQWGLIDAPINFLGEPWNARWSVVAANVWRGVPFVAISLLAGLQTIPQSLIEAAALDGATNWQRFRRVTLPLLTPIIAVVMTFSVLFTFTDFQLIYVLTRGGPVNATHLMATLSFQRGIPGGQLGEGAAIAVAMIPFLLAAILFSFFGLQRRRWQQGGSD